METFASVSKMPYGKTPEEHRAYMAWWRNLNRDDYNKKRLDWANSQRERRTIQARKSHLMRRYGISMAEFEKLLNNQDGRCAICTTVFKEMVDSLGRRKLRVHIDHSHVSGNIRGLLCDECNLGLGKFKDDPALVEKALFYLKS
jgi:hypothetical protein